MLAAVLAMPTTAIGKPVPHGPLLGKVRPRTSAALRTAHQENPVGGNLTYHGGPVVHRSTSYAIFWTGSEPAFPPPFEAGMADFLEAVAAESGSHGNVYSTSAEYADSSAVAAYENAFGGTLHDTAPLPGDGCESPYGGPCVSGGQIAEQLDSFIAANQLPRGLHAMYLVFLPPGFETCDGSYCGYTSFCAYHSWLGAGPGTTLYAVLPWPAYAPAGYPLCVWSNAPNGQPGLDTEVSIVSHEQIETFTDPLVSGWFDANREEIADKCAWKYGPPLGSSPFGEYNQLIGSDTYALQLEWSNAAAGCVAHSDAAAPPPPPNDLFENTEVLTGTTAKRSADTTFEATKEAGEPNHAGNEGGGSIWYSWTAPELGVATVSTSGSNFDTLLGVYTGHAVSALTEVASDDNSKLRTQSAVRFIARRGTSYRIAVDGVNLFGEPTGGSVHLGLSEEPAPNTRISGRHRIVTRGHRARIRFRLSATPVASRFECALDGHAFRHCRRHPLIVAAPGRHLLRARAIGAAGLRDPAPAGFSFHVLRR